MTSLLFTRMETSWLGLGRLGVLINLNSNHKQVEIQASWISHRKNSNINKKFLS